MMKMRCCIIFILVLFSLKLTGQATDTIKYVLFDSVEMALAEYIENYDKSVNYDINYYLLLARDLENYKLSIMPFKNNNDIKAIWVDKTNRFILIKKKYYPLIFDYDMSFGLIDESCGDYTNRDGNIKRAYIGGDYFSIFYNKKGCIIKQEY